MHICYLCDEYPPSPHGGVGSFVQTISRELVKRNHLVTVVGFYDVKEKLEWQDMGVRVIQLSRSKNPFLNILIHRIVLARELKLLNKKVALDIVEGPELGLAFLPKLPGVGFVIRLHGGHHFFSTELGKRPRMGRGWYEKMSFRNADFFCAVSQYVAERTRVLLKIKNRSIEIIPNPVNTELFSSTQKEEDNNLIAFVGTVCEKKGIRQLIQALPYILDVYPAVRLLVIGRDQFDKYLGMSFTENLKENTEQNVLSHISFLGAVRHDDLPALLSKISICVFPSLSESFGITIIEGMSMQKAVIASNAGPIPEIIEDGVNGLLCNPYDPHSIAEKILYVLGDSSLRKDLGRAARQKAKAEYSVDVLMKKNLTFYERCLSNERS
jgi:glycosyltransferase involved in cell wall biosynthesis